MACGQRRRIVRWRLRERVHWHKRPLEKRQPFVDQGFSNRTFDFTNYFQVIDRFGRVRHVNWTQQFQAVRRSIGIEFPAYMIHESCQWSTVHEKWFFLPRKVSFEAYDSEKDLYKAGNYLIFGDETFEHFTSVQIGMEPHPTHGFSAFQFVPGKGSFLRRVFVCF